MKNRSKANSSSTGTLLVTLLCVVCSAVAQAQTYYTNAIRGNWSNPANWTGVNGQAPQGGTNAAAVVFTNLTANQAYTNDWSSGGVFFLNQLVGPATTLSLYAPNGSSLVFTNTGGVLPAITEASGGGMNIYAPIALATNLTLSSGSSGTYFYSNITQNATAALSIQSGPTYLYGVNSYSGGTTNNNGGGYVYVNNNSSLGTGPLYLNTPGATTFIYATNNVTIANPIIALAAMGSSSSGLRITIATNSSVPISPTLIINTYSNLTPYVGAPATNTILVTGQPIVIFTNANYSGGLTIGSSSSFGASVTVAGNFTNTLQTYINPTNSLNVSGNMTALGATSGSGINVYGANNVSGTLLNNYSYAVYGVANISGFWTNGVGAATVYTNGVLNISGTANLGVGLAVRNGGAATVSGALNSFSSITLQNDTFVPGAAYGATLTVYSNGVVNNNGNTFQINSNGLCQVAGLFYNSRLYAYGGTLQLSDGTNGGTVMITSTILDTATTNSSIIGGAPVAGTLVVSNTSQTIPANLSLGGPGAYANNLILVKAGTGTLTLSGANTYTNSTIVSGGTLTLTGSGAIANTPNITVGSGATFDVSGLSTALTLGSGQTLSASATGANSTGTINMSASRGLTLSSGGLAFTGYGAGSSTAPLTLSGAGSLALSGVPVTVKTTTALVAGTYKLIAKGGSATVTGTPGTLTWNGGGSSGVVSGATPTLQVVSGELWLYVPNITAASTLSGSLASTYGTPANPMSVSVSGTGLSGNLIVTAQSGYQVCLSSGGSYNSSLTLTPSVGAVSATTVYVEYTSAKAAANYNSATAVALTSTGAATVNIATTSSGNTVGQATPAPTLTMGSSPMPYNGSAQAVSVTSTGGTPGTVGTVYYNGSSTVPTQAGSYVITADFTPTDATDYTSLSKTAVSGSPYVISQATPTPTLTMGSSPMPYNGSAQAVSVTSTGGTPGTVGTVYYNGSSTVPTQAGSYVITADFTPTDAIDYTGLSKTAVSGSPYVISQATTFVGASSSENPSGYKDSVSFQATLPSDATGSVVFSSTNGPISTNSVSNGSATSLAITNLLRGTNVITVAYLGDGNYLGSSSSLNQVVTNHPPGAADVIYYRPEGMELMIDVSDLLTNVTDVDGDTIILQSVETNSTTGATILSDASYIYYVPGTGASSNANDSFTYTVSDGYGGAATANILVDVYAATGPAQLAVPTNGVVNITFFGIPNYTFVVQTTTNLSGPWWPISTNPINTNGILQFTDPNATNVEQYYRLSQP